MLSLLNYQKHCKSIRFYPTNQESNLLGWSSLEFNPRSSKAYGRCITIVYDAKKWRVLGYLVGEYRLDSIEKLNGASLIDRDNQWLISRVKKPKYIEYLRFTNGWKLVR